MGANTFKFVHARKNIIRNGIYAVEEYDGYRVIQLKLGLWRNKQIITASMRRKMVHLPQHQFIVCFSSIGHNF